MRQEWSTAWAPLLFLSLHDRVLLFICCFFFKKRKENKKRPLKSSSKGSLFLPRVSINLWRGRRMMRELKPINKRKATPPAETPEMNHKVHEFLSVTVPHWLQKNNIWNPSGRLVWGHAIRLWNHCGGEGLDGGWRGGGATPQHMFILSAVQETSLLPSSETRPHTRTGSPSVRSHNGFLEENEWPLSISNFSSVPHQALCD